MAPVSVAKFELGEGDEPEQREARVMECHAKPRFLSYRLTVPEIVRRAMENEIRCLCVQEIIEWE